MTDAPPSSQLDLELYDPLVISWGRACAHVVSGPESSVKWLKQYLTLPPNARSPQQFPTKLYQGNPVTFGAGLLPLVKDAAKREGTRYQIADERGLPPETFCAADVSWLRDYQHEAVWAVLENHAGVLWMPTGAGKTEVAIALTRKVLGPWLFLVHRGTLVEQLAKRYKLRTGLEASRIKSGRLKLGDPDSNLTVATFQAVWKNRANPEVRDLVKSVEGLIIDEAHTLGGRTFQKVALACDNAYYRVGLSGTPFARTDDKAVLVQGATGPVIYKLEATRLVEHGVLAKPMIWMVPCYQSSDADYSNDWKQKYSELIIKSEDRNRLIVAETLEAPKPALVFVKALRHGFIIRDLLEDMGLRVELVTGRDPTELRQRKISSLESGRSDVVVASVVLQEGVDIPELRSVVVASGGKSGIATIQRVGRAMRMAEGKSDCVVIDVFDKGDYTLRRHSTDRLDSYRKEGYEVRQASPKGGFSGEESNDY